MMPSQSEPEMDVMCSSPVVAAVERWCPREGATAIHGGKALGQLGKVGGPHAAVKNLGREMTALIPVAHIA